MIQPSREQVLAWAAALTPLAVSLAANVTWGMSTGSPILIAAGIVTPLLLVLAIERWRAMPSVEGGQWWVRTLAMSGVVLVVAAWSWLHTTALLLAEVDQLHPAAAVGFVDTALRGVEVALCVAAPLAIDGLAVLSVLALGAPASAPGSVSDPPDGDEPEPQTDEQTGPGRSDDDRTGPDRRSDDELLTVLRGLDHVPTSRNGVMRAVRVGTGRADKLLAGLDTTAGHRPSGPDRTDDREAEATRERNGRPVPVGSG